MNQHRGATASHTSAFGGTVGRAVVALALSGAAVGCQSHSGPSNPSAGSDAGSSGSGSVQSATPINACAMLSPQDVAPLINLTVPGKAAGLDPRAGNCSWENPTTEESVTLEIGNPGSAPNNTLPAPVPGIPEGTLRPDGMRTNDEGVVQFASGNRRNSVQVAVIRFSADQRIAAALDLVRKVSPQVPQ